MSRLTRRHNNLRKAQARFEKISRRGKQFQLQFDRQQNNRGRYKTSGFLLGTYAAQDYDLSEAEKYYTKLAWDMNENVRLVGDFSTWKTGLSKFGVNTSGMKDTPDTFQWGNSTVYNWNAELEFSSLQNQYSA